MKHTPIHFLLLTLFTLWGCNNQSYDYPFQNPKLTFEERAADIISRLTLEEKIAQMLHHAPPIDSLGIPAYNWWNECLHGIGRTEYKVTVFPQAIAMAAGWDAQAIRTMADYTAEEGRAIYNTASAKGDYSIYHGLTYWTPNINIFRDPRWGRGQETYGEDPYLTSVLGSHFVQGLQGNDPRYWKAAGCAKHYAVHSGPEHNRHEYNAEASAYDLWDTYLPAFKTLVDANVAGVMCAYNAFEGQPCCGSDKLMVQLLRDDWGFDGYVTSDCGAIDDFFRFHKTHPDKATAAADAVFHGTDLECGNSTYYSLLEAVKNGLITESLINRSLERLFIVRMKLGMFDPKEKVAYSTIDSTRLEAPEHKALALKMARQSIVMLKNDNTLPVDKSSLTKIAIVGPNANNPEVQLGNYNGFPSRIITPYEGLKDALGNEVEIYCDPVINYYGESSKSFTQAIDKFKDADLIIYAGGISPRIEGEEMDVNAPGFYKGDRTSINLPTIQTDFMKALKETGKPVVFIMMTGSAIAIPWEAEHIPVILNAWYGGESIGTALADIIFGNYNPSGRLPVTFYTGDASLPDFEDYNMDNRTYKYFNGDVLYPFGYGLSYSDFTYEWGTHPKDTYKEEEIIEYSVRIKNTGFMDGDEVCQLYIKYPQSGERLPLKELRGFERTHIPAGAEAEVKFSIPVAHLAKWNNEAAKQEVVTGKYSIYTGSHSADERLVAKFTIH